VCAGERGPDDATGEGQERHTPGTEREAGGVHVLYDERLRRNVEAGCACLGAAQQLRSVFDIAEGTDDDIGRGGGGDGCGWSARLLRLR